MVEEALFRARPGSEVGAEYAEYLSLRLSVVVLSHTLNVNGSRGFVSTTMFVTALAKAHILPCPENTSAGMSVAD